jgi:truncated hemoglobin YjbI
MNSSAIDATQSSAIATHTSSAFERLGGEDGISRLVSEFIDTMRSDARIASVSSPEVLAQHGYETWPRILASITGGPHSTQDFNVEGIHKQMPITAGHFDAVMDDLCRAARKLGVENDIQLLLISRLEVYRSCLVKAV